MVVVIGSGSNAYTYNPSNPSDTSRPSPSQQNQYKEMAESMKKAGIRGVSGRTLVTDDDERGFNVGEKAREIQKNYLEERDPVVRTPYEDTLFDFGLDLDNLSGVAKETAGDPIRQKIVSNILRGKPSKKTGIFGIDFNNLQFPSLPGIATFGASALEGMNANSVLFKKLLKGSELDSSDKVALVTLFNNSSPFDLIKEYAKKNELSNDELSNISQNYAKEYDNILGAVEGEDVNINNYIKRMNDMGLGETVGTMYGDLTGQRDIPEGITTLENITDNLGSEGLAYLKLTDPKTYYRLRPAQTSGQIEELARTALTGNKNFDNQIFAAREQAARNKESQDRASGIMRASSAPPVPPPVTDQATIVPPEMKEDPVPENPILNPVMSQRDPFNLAQFYASLPQYTQQGVMSPSLMQYYRNLGLFPRS